MTTKSPARQREHELTEHVIAQQTGEWESAAAAHELALLLRDLEDADDSYGLELLERRALELVEGVERSLAPRNDGQQTLFEADRILRLGDGRSVKLGHVEDPAQLDRAHAIRTRQHAGQAVSYAAWTMSYVGWREAMIATGLPLRAAIEAVEA